MSTNTYTVPALLQLLATFCATQNVAAWLTGGATRDLVLGSVPQDLDVVVATDGIALARKFANKIGEAFVVLDDERGTGRIICMHTLVEPGKGSKKDRDVLPPTDRLTVDIAQFRAPTLEADLRLRDFTMNALALPLTATNEAGEIIPVIDHPLLTPDRQSLSPDPPSLTSHITDPCGGLNDLATRTLRLCNPTGLSDDPARVLRAVRLAARLGLHIPSELNTSLQEAIPLLEKVAIERISDELLKLFSLPIVAPWLRYMDQIGLLTYLFPELEPARSCDQPIVHFLPVLAHSIETVAAVDWLLEPLLTDDKQLAPNDARGRDHSSPVIPQAALPVAVQTYPDLPRTLPYSAQLQAHFLEKLGSGFPRAALFKLAALLHDNAKPQTKQLKEGGGVSFYAHQSQGAEVASAIAQRLHLSRQSAIYIARIIQDHMRPGQLRDTEVTPRAIARFFRDTADAGPDVLLHALADHMAARGPSIDPQDWRGHLDWTAQMLDLYLGQPPEFARPLITGRGLMSALNIPPGPLVGELLREIQEARVAGEITTPEEALALAQRILAIPRDQE